MVVSAALSPRGNLGKDHQGFVALNPGQVLLHQGRALQALLLHVKSLGADTSDQRPDDQRAHGERGCTLHRCASCDE